MREPDFHEEKTVRQTTLATCIAGLIAVLAAAATARAEDPGPSTKTIAEVRQDAEHNDYVTVEGWVADVRVGHGNRMVVILEDESGSVPLAVPNHLSRQFAGAKATGGTGPTGAEPRLGARARVGGKWDHEHMNDENWGIRVERVEPLGN
jgi:hypothetical protein